ncbi:MAG: ABC transporter ATP-binding protein [Clostridia bacterium]|nr:ABC transporter ATP-binding protein [Clostridia bacterium]
MLIAKNLYKSYKNREILHDVSLAVKAGDFVSIMGESGSGKSTLLAVLAGNLAPDSGTVLLDGQDLAALSERDMAALRRTKLGFVYQSLNLIPTLTGRDNILLPLYLGGKRAGDAAEKLNELTELLGIAGVFDAFPAEMSGGEQQRVAIARSLLYDPAVLMLDEPTGSLDSASTRQVMELLTRINRELGVCVIQVTHSREAAAYGNRILTLVDGRISAQ